MNRENLQRMADYIRTIPQKHFTMETYRDQDDNLTKECNSVGCVIGHCIVLDERPIETLPKRKLYGTLDFVWWATEFTGINFWEDSYKWMFSSIWTMIDNTPEGAALRIEWLLNNGLPKDCQRQMSGVNSLCYYNNDTEEKIL